jgi:predicted Zn-dependent protease
LILDQGRKILEEITSSGAEFADLRAEFVNSNIIRLGEGIPRRRNEKGLLVRGLFRGNWGVVSTNQLDNVKGGEVAKLSFGDERGKVVRLKPAKIELSSPIDEGLSIYSLLQDLPKIKDVEVELIEEDWKKEYLSTDEREIEQRWKFFFIKIGDGEEWRVTGGLVPPSPEIVEKLVDEALEMRTMERKASWFNNYPKRILLTPRLVSKLLLLWIKTASPEPPDQLKIDERVGVEHVQVKDLPAPLSSASNLFVDDEGVEGRELTLISNGVLINVMTDRSSSAYYGLRPTGNGRASTIGGVPSPTPRNIVFQCEGDTLDQIEGELNQQDLILLRLRNVSLMGNQIELIGDGKIGEVDKVVRTKLELNLKNFLQNIIECSKDLYTSIEWIGRIPIKVTTPFILLR